MPNGLRVNVNTPSLPFAVPAPISTTGLKMSIEMSEHVNPFVFDTPIDSVYERTKLAVLSLTLFPVRLVVVLALLILSWIVAKVATMGAREGVPMSSWRRQLLLIVQYLARATLFVCGYYYIPTRGTLANVSEAPIIVAASHTGLMEGFYIEWIAAPSMMSVGANKHTPFLGALLASSQPIWVDRTNSESRHKAVTEIKTRVSEGRGKWPHLCIFPEGLCTNRKSVVTFKAGAFVPGVPVQPIAIKFPYKHFNMCTLSTGPGPGTQMWRMMCQFVNHMEVEFLPVYTPSAAELENPAMYAQNVRTEMAGVLGVPMTSHSYDDLRLGIQAHKAHLDLSGALVEMDTVHKLYDVTLDDAQELLKKFVDMDVTRSGSVTLHEFAQFLNLPVNDDVSHLFSLLDVNQDGSLDFREFLLGMLFMSSKCHNKDVLAFAFDAFNQDKDSVISHEEFVTVMRSHFPTISASSVESLFKEVDANGSGVIERDEFVAFAEKHPEYVLMVMDHNGLVSGQSSAKPSQ